MLTTREDVVVVNEVETDYIPGLDHILVSSFLESGCGCKRIVAAFIC